MDYLIISKWANMVRIPSTSIPTLSSKSKFIKAMKLADKDEILTVLEIPEDSEKNLLLIEVNGGAKKVKLSELAKMNMEENYENSILACAILVD